MYKYIHNWKYKSRKKYPASKCYWRITRYNCRFKTLPIMKDELRLGFIIAPWEYNEEASW